MRIFPVSEYAPDKMTLNVEVFTRRQIGECGEVLCAAPAQKTDG